MEIIFVMTIVVFIAGLILVAVYALFPKNNHKYYSHTSKIDPENSHGNTEPHV